MSFTSGPFFVLLALFALLWPAVRRRNNLRWATITAFSLVFYGWWDWRFLWLLIGTGGIDYLAALLMERSPRHRSLLLWISIVSNLGALCFFKYLGFMFDQLAFAWDIPQATRDWTHDIVLPVGISFYTFQSLSYTIDVYRRELRAVKNPAHFFAFLTMFPQLVAGPIVRATDLLPQLETPGHYNESNRWHGVRRVAWGFLKKVVVADHLAPVVNDAFAANPDIGLGWWAIAGCFAIQIFCDFSGYSDIACGIARWMGYQFPENFKQPYAAVGVRDFWARWHITLSTWFRDYLYIPLGGSRGGPLRVTLVLMTTMLVSGLWHGANWTFVMWGVYHGTLLASERAAARWFGRGCSELVGIARVAALAVTLAAVVLGWVFFRSESVRQASQILASMVGLKGIGTLPDMLALPSVRVALMVLAVGAGYWALIRRRPDWSIGEFPRWFAVPLVALALCIALFFRGPGNDFIYFQF